MIVQNWNIVSIVVFCHSLALLIAAVSLSTAIIYALSFLQFKEFELYWGAVFSRLEEEYWRSPFFNQFYWSKFWSGKWHTWKNLEWFCCWKNWRVERKECDFCSYLCFLESEKLRCEKNSVSERIFLFTCGILQAVFSFFGSEIWLWFCFNFRLVSVVVWRFLQIILNFMLIRRFFMYFADFRATFAFFWRLFCFTGSNVYWRDLFYLSKFLITISRSLCIWIIFFVEKYDKNSKNCFFVFCF